MLSCEIYDHRGAHANFLDAKAFRELTMRDPVQPFFFRALISSHQTAKVMILHVITSSKRTTTSELLAQIGSRAEPSQRQKMRKTLMLLITKARQLVLLFRAETMRTRGRFCVLYRTAICYHTSTRISSACTLAFVTQTTITANKCWPCRDERLRKNLFISLQR